MPVVITLRWVFGCVRLSFDFVSIVLISACPSFLTPLCEFSLYCRDLHGDGDHGNPAGMEANVAGFRGDGNKRRGTPTWMEQNCAGFLQECSSI